MMNLCVLVSVVLLFLLPSTASGQFIEVSENGRGFYLMDRPFVVRGFNYFEGMWLGMLEKDGGNRSRLLADLDALENLGVNTVRVMTGSLGPDGSPYRWTPAVYPTPLDASEQVLQGLDYLLVAFEERKMRAIISLGDFWQASGGFGQYVSWVTNETIPYPPSFPDFTGSWDAYISYARRFYNDTRISAQCQDIFQRHIGMILKRVNTISHVPYQKDTTIMAWEIANEPQRPPFWWIHQTAKFIKKLAPRHLVTSGLEGKEEDNCQTFNELHSSEFIDFATIHCWVENWGVYQPYNMSKANLDAAVKFAQTFLESRNKCSNDSFKKPVLLEEFGLARDGQTNLTWTSQSSDNRYSPKSSTTHRDFYFNSVCNTSVDLLHNGYIAGMMVWAWSGQGRPTDHGPRRLGDPPHETPGWYSIFDSDTSTLEELSSCFKKLSGHGVTVA